MRKTVTARSPLAGVICAAVVVSVITLLIYPLQELDPGVSSGVLYVLGVLLVATYWGLWLGLLTSVASAAALNYFHTSPTGEFFTGKDAGDLVAQTAVPILPDDTAQEVFDKVTVAAEMTLDRAMPGLLAGNAPRTPLDLAVHGDVAATLRAVLPLVDQKPDRSFLDEMLRGHARALEQVVDAYTRDVEHRVPIHPEYAAIKLSIGFPP